VADSEHCAVCGSSGPFATTLDILLRCPVCSLIFARLPATDAEVRALYGASYFAGDEYADYLGDKAVIQRSFHRKLQYMQRWVPTSARLFEIGAAYGFFLDAARARAPWESVGIDISEDAAAYARARLGVDVHAGDFLSADVPRGRYDVFCMWDTIEHLAQPDLYVERVAELIAPGGYFFISTGDIDSRVARRKGRSWRLIHPPTHLYYFSRATLSRLLERVGFRVCDVTPMGLDRSIRQTVYSLLVQKRPRLMPLYRRFANTRLAGVGFYVDLGDIMVVCAQAPDWTRA